MPGVSKEQIAAAKKMTAIEFLRRYRSTDLVKSSAHGEFELRSHDSFKINGESSIWHWKSRGIGGKSALDYLVHVEQCGFVEAVRMLCDEVPGYIPVPHEAVEQKRPAFTLPPAAPNNARVVAYLCGRGISPVVLSYCVDRGLVYESLPYHNCVFVGKDETGTARYAALRGTYSYGRPFKAETPGSDKRYGFCIPPLHPSTTVAVFEAAIDAMAEMTLSDNTADKYRLSLGGIYAPEQENVEIKTPVALVEFLRQHPEVDTIQLCTDNDEPGRNAALAIARNLGGKYKVSLCLPQIEGGDYADLAKQIKQARRACTRHRTELAR